MVVHFTRCDKWWFMDIGLGYGGVIEGFALVAGFERGAGLRYWCIMGGYFGAMDGGFWLCVFCGGG